MRQSKAQFSGEMESVVADIRGCLEFLKMLPIEVDSSLA